MPTMPSSARALALTLAAALASPTLADDPVSVPVATEPAVIESARLDPAVIEQAAGLELFGMSSAATTALIVVVIAVALTVTSSSDSQGIPP